jgi:broad specificity phosphatase PhoE
VQGDDRLREAVRPWIGTGYRAVAHRYLRGEQPEGWEPHDSVSVRVAAAVADAQRSAGGAPIIVVTHGLALAIHLGDRLGPDFDRESFWSRLAFPDAWALDDDVLHRSLPAPSER